MNDTVGQLAAAAYKYGDDCVAAVVIGYGYVNGGGRLAFHLHHMQFAGVTLPTLRAWRR